MPQSPPLKHSDHKKGKRFRQVAALCYRRKKNRHEILLIRSQGRGRWILPKGWPMQDRPAQKTALIEAFEEAGVKGVVRKKSIGEYTYTKLTNAGKLIDCIADAYVIEVKHQLDDFPEKDIRRLKWLSPKAAAALVDEPSLRQLILRFKPQQVA